MNTLTTIKQALSNRNYTALFTITSIILFALFYYFTLATTTNQSISIFIMMNGIKFAIISFSLLAIIALLSGLYISLVVYKIRLKQKEKSSKFLGSLGIITGLFAAGCPMCGAFLFGLLGFPLVLFFLPYKGTELKLLAILLLLVSIYLITRKNKCNLNYKK